jgi:type I restriction-modification system DNA methylase subunit
MPRKDKNITPSVTQKLQSLGYNVADWDDSLTASKLTKEILQVLKTASKKENGNIGYPDRIYVNSHNKFLVLVEEKPSVKDHDNPYKEKGAISGSIWYLSRFLNSNLDVRLKKFFDNWKILSIAVSGDLLQEYQHKFNCYTIDAKEEKIIALTQVTNFMTEEQFLALFNSLDEEKAVATVSSSSKKINNLLRSVDSQKRPVLLSALMICLHRVKPNAENYINDFPDHYKTYQPTGIINNVLYTVRKVLSVEGIPDEKLRALSTELAFLTTDQTLNNTSILNDILIELETAVIPLFNNQFVSNSNYDIIGKFYEEFLKYAGVSNVKKGIVLTPRHVTTLFTKLIDLKDNDKIVDICCGTGAFLIAGMNALVNKIGNSSRTDKDDAIKKVKEKQLLGFELNPTMYICAISNMLFRGDGKSSIFNYDSIKNTKAQEELNRFNATIGFINPPYSGKENKDDPTPKEITFLIKLLDNCSRYGIIIAPLSTYFKNDSIREGILKKHTLKYVINMPNDLFQPNASTHTAIAVFETNRSFDYKNDEVLFYDLRDDGFVLSKNKGRTDIYARWPAIEKQLLDTFKPNTIPDNITFVRTKIKPKDEWTIYAHSKTDYSTLSEEDFIKSISDYMIFQAKKDLDILDKELTETELLGAVSSYYSENNDDK